MLYEIDTIYAKTFAQNPRWLEFFSKYNICCFIESSSVASYLNACTIQDLLQFKDLDKLVQYFDGNVASHAYLAALFVREKYDFPYHDIFSGDLEYQHYRGWRLFFSTYLKQHPYKKSLTQFVMKTIDLVFKWEAYQINLALTLLYEWIKKAQKHGYNVIIFDLGNDFEAFISQIGYVLFSTKDNFVMTRELCKMFRLTFEGLHSFDALMQHFRIWNGERNFYGKKPRFLSERLVTSVRCDSKKVIFF
ncbi:MAG: hypothetical protein H6850_00565 [Alphaproteobacteria bacterium]|nr:MAG: hypothetical protein H6850_00565 [Alphaproteobacteria bacterium]